MFASDGQGADPELIERLRDKDKRALALAYDRYGHLVYSLLVRITRNPALAEDLLVEVFFRLWTHSPVSCSDKGSLSVWIFSIARTMALDQIRSGDARFRTRPCSLEEVHVPESATFESSGPLIARETMRAAFAELTTNQQRVLELAYFEGLSQSEIAVKLEEPVAIINSWMRSGLSRMRAAVQENQHDSTAKRQILGKTG